MLKGKSNLVFIGFMGCGKTSVANKLGQRMCKPVISTDKLIEEKEGRSIADIFKKNGEAYFRKLERSLVQEISLLKDSIIDCGGGVILDQQNIDDLKKNGYLIYLTASPEFLYEQVKSHTHRPLLLTADPLAAMAKLLNERKDKYAQADIILVSEDKSIDAICDEVLELIKND